MAIALLGLAACASKDSVTLLPGADGNSGAVAVLDADGGTVAVVDKPYSQAKISGTKVETEQSNQEAIEAQYGPLLETLPPAPTGYVLYFETGATVLTKDSEPKLSDLLREVPKRPGAEVEVTGHTDTVGPLEDNDALSLKRAVAVRDLLISRGLDAALVRAVGRGERDLLVATDDDTDEPLNRRVTVTVR